MKSFFTKNRTRKAVAALGMAFVLSASMVSFAACDNSDNTDPDQNKTTRTDTCAIANGDFEYFTDDNQLTLINSPSGWTKASGTDKSGNTASSSSTASGIVDTDKTLWNSVTTINQNLVDGFTDWKADVPDVKKAMSAAEKVWSDMNINDRLYFYDLLEDAITAYNKAKSDTVSMSDFKYYDDYRYSVGYDDVPSCENPGTHKGTYEYDSEAKSYAFTDLDGKTTTGIKAEDADSGVLMIHNHRSTDNYGTAQKYTSSTTVTLEAGTAAELSVWVKTEDLTYNKDALEVNGNRGAYIGVTHTVGGTTLDQMQIKNIDTSGVTENNGWVEYTVYLRACAYASSNFTVVLGLGQGSSSNSFEYVDGYAFFDDVDYTVISDEAYETATAGLGGAYKCEATSLASKKLFATDKADYKDQKVYALDLGGNNYSSLSIGNSGDVSIRTGLTSTKQNGKYYATAVGTDKDGNATNLLRGWESGLPTTNDYAGLTSWNDLNAMNKNAYLANVWADDFADGRKSDNDSNVGYPFDKDEKLLLLFSGNGAAYTARMDAVNDFFTLQPDERMSISFWVKTSDTSSYTGATINLYDGLFDSATATALGSYNTTTISTVDIQNRNDDGSYTTTEDIYDGWARCFFFVENATVKPLSFRLEFSYGATSIADTTKTSYCEGYAAFTGFEFKKSMSSTEYSVAGTASRSTSVSLTGKNSSITTSGFDTPVTADEDTIKENLALLSSYKGVYGGTGRTATAEGVTPVSEKLDANKNAGLLNKYYFTGFSEEADSKSYAQLAKEAKDAGDNETYAWLDNILAAAGSSLTNALNDLEGTWNALFGTATQPLLISNVTAQSYGYIANNSTLSSSSYSTVSVRVKASAGAKAYIYLIDTSDVLENGYRKTQSMEMVNATYWYDDNFHNVLIKDPSSEDFKTKEDTAFMLTDSGVYKNYQDANDEKLYANLANYDKDDDGNLIFKTDSSGKPVISYNYSDDYTDDGIAYYYNKETGKYYLTDSYETEIHDFSEAKFGGKNFTTEYARYLNVKYLPTLNVTEADLGENVTVIGKTNVETYMVIDTEEHPELADKWVTVSFYIHTGDESLPYRLELFSGSRDGKVQSGAGSYVAYDVCNSGSLSDSYSDLVDDAIESLGLTKDKKTGRLLKADGTAYENTDYYCYTFFDDPDFQRYDSALDENEYGNVYDGYTQSNYSETMTYLYCEKAVGDEYVYSMFLDYSPIYQAVSADSTIDVTPDEDTTDNWWEDANFWLMLSSIALAVVLVVVMIIMLIRKMLKNSHKKAPETGRYDARRAHYMKKLNLKEESDEEATASETEETSAPSEDAPSVEDPYND